MKLLQIFKTKKIFFFQIFLTLYIGINLIGGERGLASYFEKKEYEKNLEKKVRILSSELSSIEKKNKLLSKNIDLDYLDTLYRDKLKFGKKEEIIIKLKLPILKIILRLKKLLIKRNFILSARKLVVQIFLNVGVKDMKHL